MNVLAEGDPGWRERALARSLEKAQIRSLDEIDRLFGAASRLAVQRGDTGFTVQQVASEAGVSLKAFYRHFAGKEDLLFALFEEYTRRGAALLEETVASETDPVDRLRAAIRLLSDVPRNPGSGVTAFIAREHFRLAVTRPHDLGRALMPLIGVLADEIAAAARAGAVASTDPMRDATSVFALAVAYIQARVLGTSDDDPATLAAHLWSFCARALGMSAEIVHRR